MSSNTIPVNFEREEAVKAAHENLNFLGAICLEDIFKYLFPPIFLAIWQILTTAIENVRGKTFLAIGIPRGFGKTILLKLYVVYIILFTDRRFILIVCNTQQLAENFLSDVVDMLTTGNILAIFGDWRLDPNKKDTLSLKKFHFRGRAITIAAAGAGTSLRGLNIKFVRPDVIIMDDMQSREQAESHVEAIKVLSWMLGTLLKAASPERCLYIFVGNMYPFEGSILKKLKYNPAWTSFICGAILEDGQSIWPELKPVEELITELENDTSMGHPEIFYSEVMNDEEAGTRSGVDITRIAGLTANELPDFPEAGCVIIDPSLTTKNSDDTVLGVMLVFNSIPVLRELKMGKLTPLDTIKESIKLALKYNLSVIVIEGQAYQATLSFWFNQVCGQLGITGITPLLIHNNRMSKVSRILTMFKELVSQKIRIHEEVRSVVVNQIVHFNPLKPRQNKDDILDVLAFMSQIMTTYPGAIEIQILTSIERDVVTASTEEDLQLAF